jgi:hypothetical protein
MSDVTTEKVELLTPYAVSKLVNTELETLGLPPVKPQMVYNYVRNNLIPASNNRITKSDAEAWVTKYVARKLAKASA